MGVSKFFKPGDVVKLASGGPEMTVESYSREGIKCIWFCGNKLESKLFPAMVLTKIEDDEKKE